MIGLFPTSDESSLTIALDLSPYFAASKFGPCMLRLSYRKATQAFHTRIKPPKGRKLLITKGPKCSKAHFSRYLE